MSRLVVVSNRIATPPKGDPSRHSTGGLAVALQEALQAEGGIWFGWSGHTAEEPSLTPSVSTVGRITYAQIDLSPTDHEEYYNGYANATLWPLFHYRLDLAEFRRVTYAAYRRVNIQFARGLAPLLRDDDVVWIHDYHLIPLAGELRHLGFHGRIGFFLHTPFPVPEVLTALPNWGDIGRALCAHDLIGFQTPTDCEAFVRLVDHHLGGETLGNGQVRLDGRTVHAECFPIGLDLESMRERDDTSSAARLLEKSINGRALIIGVDRLDYSKGLPQRFEAFGALLDMAPDLLNKVVMMQIAPPSRTDVTDYQAIRAELERIAGHVNGAHSDLDWTPLRYLNRGFSRRVLADLFRIARVGLVTPLRDGMNLVAKEYVAAQSPDDPGVLVLSHFAGAAVELGGGAVLVNPHDIEGTADRLRGALTMGLDERKARWENMMAILRRNTITAWRKAFLAALG
jgi:trehalose 6-phosphate synthase